MLVLPEVCRAENYFAFCFGKTAQFGIREGTLGNDYSLQIGQSLERSQAGDALCIFHFNIDKASAAGESFKICNLALVDADRFQVGQLCKTCQAEGFAFLIDFIKGQPLQGSQCSHIVLGVDNLGVGNAHFLQLAPALGAGHVKGLSAVFVVVGGNGEFFQFGQSRQSSGIGGVVH